MSIDGMSSTRLNGVYRLGCVSRLARDDRVAERGEVGGDALSFSETGARLTRHADPVRLEALVA